MNHLLIFDLDKLRKDKEYLYLSLYFLTLSETILGLTFYKSRLVLNETKYFAGLVAIIVNSILLLYFIIIRIKYNKQLQINSENENKDSLLIFNLNKLKIDKDYFELSLSIAIFLEFFLMVIICNARIQLNEISYLKNLFFITINSIGLVYLTIIWRYCHSNK